MDFKQNEAFLNSSYGLSGSHDHMMNNRLPNMAGLNQQNPHSFQNNGFNHQLSQFQPMMPQMDHLSQEKDSQIPQSDTCPAYDKAVNYYHEFWRMYLQNEVLISSMKDYVVKTKEIQGRISQLEATCHELELNLLSNIKKESMKKKRRTANEIEKNFTCPYEGCQRSYGSDVSLNLHIKLKHGGGNKTEREKLAKMIIEAKLKNEDMPEINLNLPPGFFENIDLDKLSKIKEKKDKTEYLQSSLKESGNLKELLKENNMNETDLLNLLSDLHSKELESEPRKKFKADTQNSKSPSDDQDGIYQESPKSEGSIN